MQLEITINVFIRQNLMYKDGPRTKRVIKYLLYLLYLLIYCGNQAKQYNMTVTKSMYRK